MKIWVDDLRPVPRGYEGTKSVKETYYPIAIHTANPVGRANMERMIERYWP